MSFRLPSVIVYQELLSTTISPTTPFMELCVVGPVYQCENGVSLPEYTIHTTKVDEAGSKVYQEDYPELKIGAIVDKNSPYITISDVNVKVWPSVPTIEKKAVVVDNDGPTTVIRSWPETSGIESLEDPDTEIKINDVFDLVYIDPLTEEQVVKEAAIFSIEDIKDPETGLVTGKNYVLKKNILTNIDTAKNEDDVLAGKVKVEATVKRSVEGTFTVLPDQTSEQSNRGFKCTDSKMIIIVGGLQLATNPDLDGHTIVVDCKVAASYRALRTDIANDFINITSYSQALAQLGNPNIDNPMSVAAQIISTAVGDLSYKVLPIAADTTTGYIQALDILSNNEKVYVIQPLSHEKEVIDAYIQHCKAMSEALKSKWRIIYGNMPMPATKIVVELNKGTLMSMGVDTEYTNDVLFSENDPNWQEVEMPGAEGATYSLTLNYTGKYLATYKKDGNVFKPYGFISCDEEAKTVTITSPSAPMSGKVMTMDEATGGVPENATCYLKDLDSNVGGFLTNRARATDYIDLYTVDTATKEVKYCYSLMIKEVKTDSACVCFTQKYLRSSDGYYKIDGKFQHFIEELKDKTSEYKDLTDCTYEVVRPLTDTGELAEAISAVAQSYKTKRFRYVQPDQIIVSINSVDYLVGGEYLCIALAAMRAGFPPHQGFSTMGITGIKRVTRSNKLFNEDQLAEMASNGVFLVAQDTVESLPYVLYQTTTDTGQLEVAEDSIVAVVDYASKFYKDNLKDVLGRYNVNTISMNYVKNVINACSNDMTTTSYEYIGPILTSAQLLSVVAEGDKIKPTIKIGVPYPVNGVDITLQV